tara:strand:- start:445 stop:1152 length:708 start_codon:yes stop_codon:yes gene_type:complete
MTKEKSNVIFIAEIGLNHNGNFGLIYELIKQASWSGADIAKFQLGWRAGENEMNCFKEDDIKHIFQCCKNFEIKPMFSIFTDDALTLAKKFEFDHFKIASRTVKDDPKLSQKIIDQGKKTYISLGMWESEVLPFKPTEKIKYLWCKSNYPAYPWDLTDLPKDFDNSPYCGLSDHSVGIDIPLLAISRGARVIEKHFTLDKSDTTIRDHALSALPDEFFQMVKIGSQIRKNLNFGV